MALNNRKITVYANPVASLSDHPSQAGMTAAQLKAAFDANATGEIKASINGIVDDLKSVVDGASGADEIGATPLKEGGAANVQGQLEEINALETPRTDAENIRISQENTRKSNEVTREANEVTRIANENTRLNSENTRVSSENTRVANEGTRVSSENIRIANENARKVYENYSNTKNYVVGNKVYYNGSSYINIVNCVGVLPTDITKWLLISAGGNTPAASAVPIEDAGSHFLGTNVEQALQETAQQINDLDAQKAEQTALNTEISDRLTEVAIERARIDSFTTLAEGSTTGDAELIDARVGADGIIYTNVGDAIRWQAGRLTNEIVDYYTDINIIDLWSRKIVTYNTGVLTASTTQITTNDYISGEIVKINTADPLYVMLVYAYENDVYIGYMTSNGIGQAEGGLWVTEYDIIALRTMYPQYKFRLSVKKTSGAVFLLDEYVNVALQTNVYKWMSYTDKVVDENIIDDSIKTKDIGYTLLSKGLSTNGTLGADSTVTKVVQLNVVKGERYRFSVSDGYCVGFTYNALVYWYSQRMLEVEFSTTGTVNIGFRRNGQIEFDANSIIEMNLKIEKVVFFNKNGAYDKIVASSQASEAEKLLADFVCDGVNDEIEIECALNCNISNAHSANVLLIGGDFIVDKFYECYIGITRGRGFNAIRVNKSVVGNGYYTARLTGQDLGHRSPSSDLRLYVSEICYNSLTITKSDEYSIIGAVRKLNTSDMGQYSMELGLCVNNIFVSPYDIEKPICCIDGCGFALLAVDNIRISRMETTLNMVRFDNYSIPDGLIGIRGVHGSNRGVGSYIKHTMVMGMHEGLAITGEHWIIEDTLMHSCIYGFTIGNYPVSTQMEHPIVFIGCSVEQCQRFGLLNRYGATVENIAESPKQTLIYIGGSTETTVTDSLGVSVDMLPIKEVVKGSYRGRFESDFVAQGRIFESGSGAYIKSTNTFRICRGTFAQRPYQNFVEEGHEYFATDTNQKFAIINGIWVELNYIKA